MSSTRAEVCAVACAELFRDAGEIMVSPMTNMASVGARLIGHGTSVPLPTYAAHGTKGRHATTARPPPSTGGRPGRRLLRQRVTRTVTGSLVLGATFGSLGTKVAV